MAERTVRGGWWAGGKYYKASSELADGHDYVDWAAAGDREMNPWISVRALSVLKAAGRL